jgi:aquaporin Z
MAAEPSMRSKLAAEFVGTFLLVFTVGCNVLSKNATWGGVSIACSLMVAIYALGSVSGANFNPAVSLSLGITKAIGGGGMPWSQVAMYMATQVVAGMAASAAYVTLFGESFKLSPTKGWDGMLPAIVCELLYTCMLCFVVLNVAVASRATPNKYYGLAIGFVIVAGAYGAGAISGGCFNPAVAIGIDSSNLRPLQVAVGLGENLGWSLVYAAAEFAGAALAAGLFYAVRPEDFGCKSGGLPAKLTSEFLGTYMLVFTVGLNVCANSPAAAFSIAASLMCMIYALGNVSGAMFNPAVTLAVVCSGVGDAPDIREAGYYMLTQITAGVCAAFSFHGIACGVPFGPVAPHGWAAVSVAEIFFTFVLCFVVLSVACSKTANDQFFGLAIGSCVTAGGFAIGGISGGSLNPAVSFGLAAQAVLGGGSFWEALVYTAFELVGGALAAGVFKVTHAFEDEEAKGKKAAPSETTYLANAA